MVTVLGAGCWACPVKCDEGAYFTGVLGAGYWVPGLPRREVYPVKLLALCNPRSGATQLHRAGNI